MTPEQLDALVRNLRYIGKDSEGGPANDSADAITHLRTALAASEAHVAGMREAAITVLAKRHRQVDPDGFAGWELDAAICQIRALTDADADAALAARDKRVREEARMVKPLVWLQFDSRPERAATDIGDYLLSKDFDGWYWMRTVDGRLMDICQTPSETVEAAKAAVQADYDARIKSALIEDTQP